MFGPVVKTAQGPRDYMEDRHLIQTIRVGKRHYNLICVFDGHGGSETAQICAESFAHVLTQILMANSYDIPVAMIKAFKSMDAVLLANPNHNHIGNTCVLALIDCHTGKIWFANAGDSMAMVVYNSGEAKFVSYEHKASDSQEQKRVIAAGGVVSYWGDHRIQGILNVSRSMGDAYLKKYVISIPNVQHVQLDVVNYFVMASDGIWDVFKDPVELSQIINCKLLKKPVNVQGIVDSIVKMAYERGSHDNITLIMCPIHDTPPCARKYIKT